MNGSKCVKNCIFSFFFFGHSPHPYTQKKTTNKHTYSQNWRVEMENDLKFWRSSENDNEQTRYLATRLWGTANAKNVLVGGDIFEYTWETPRSAMHLKYESKHKVNFVLHATLLLINSTWVCGACIEFSILRWTHKGIQGHVKSF